ncbi:hypothetical protein DNK49_13540 [Azoarcus communis]|uniref:Integrase catalytic domain-containing protein n=1 Tax=Parazoarcus communis SWub3 = DSM 12120 TaxID=1121029 RepID=A0A323UWM4_9RHOO|nr:hypothetical protein DNK49_13540 [Azoarcus communis] [Parazoarcus communis SWub3 = DSM 12120]
MSIRADFRGFPYPAPSDGRSAELGAFGWLSGDLTRRTFSADLRRHQPVDDAATTVTGELFHAPDHRTTLGMATHRQRLHAHATRWLWLYNHERPNMALGGITPKQRLAMAA